MLRNPFGFPEGDTLCSSLVSPRAVCKLNSRYELKRLKQTKYDQSRVSFTRKCSAPSVSPMISHSSYPCCSTDHEVRPPPPSSLQDSWSTTTLNTFPSWEPAGAQRKGYLPGDMVPDGCCPWKPVPKLKDHCLGHDYLIRDRIQFSPLCEKGLILESTVGNCLAVQWLRCGTFTTIGLDSIPGQGTNISQALWHPQKKKNPQKQKTTVVNALRNTILRYFYSHFRGSYGKEMASPDLGSGRQRHWYSQKEFKF